jgi:hypothetical protein
MATRFDPGKRAMALTARFRSHHGFLARLIAGFGISVVAALLGAILLISAVKMFQHATH